VAEVEEETTVKEWRWMPSHHNVADDATRQTPVEFSTQHRWFTGPTLLYLPEEEWPQEIDLAATPTNTGEEKVHATAVVESAVNDALPDIRRFSSWSRPTST
jgi:hypothetical protein